MSRETGGPEFLSALVLERLCDTSADGRGTWRLRRSLVYLSPLAGVVRVPCGFVTDLASVPRLPFVFFLLSGYGHAAAVVHDWLYTEKPMDRETCDRVFSEALQACGVPAWRAWLMLRGVRAFGRSNWQAPPTPQDEPA